MKKIAKISCILMALSLLLVTSSCEKDNLSRSELLVNHIWRFDKMTTTSSDENIQALVTFVSAMMTGATLEFKEDGSYIITVLNQDDDGIWELSDDEDTLFMDGDGMSITKLTKDELILDGEDVDDELGTYHVTMYWKK
jgi:hypothetical protein